MKRKTPLRPVSQHPAAVARRDALREAQAKARKRWGYACLVPGCRNTGDHLHHAYTRAAWPEWRMASWNLVPLCRRHHRQAQDPTHWLYAALREVADETRAAEEGRRPEPTWGEAMDILRRHREAAEKPHVSPMGETD